MCSSRRTRRHFVALSLLGGAACAPAPVVTASSAAVVHSASNVITEKDLADPMLAGSTVLEAVRRLRPRFLNDRSGGREGGPKVSVNGSTAFLATDELARLGVIEVSEIRYLSEAEAGQRFGLHGTLSPILLVTLRRP